MNVKFDRLTDVMGDLSNNFQKLNNKVDKLSINFEKLNYTVEKVALAVVKNSEEIADLKRNSATKTDIWQLMNQVDKIEKKVDILMNKDVMNDDRFNRFGAQVDNHENRLIVLERER